MAGAPRRAARFGGAASIPGAMALHSVRRRPLLPWASVSTVAEDVSPASLEVLSTRTGRSRFPVVQRSTRRVLGFVHVKDVLGYEGASRRAPIPVEVVRRLTVVPPDRSLADLLIAMRRERQHMVL